MKKENFVQGYFQIERAEETPELLEQLAQLQKSYLIEWNIIKKLNGDDLYYSVMRDSSKIEDSTDDEDNVIPGIMTIMGARNPQLLGVWKLDGTPLGMTKEVTPATYTEEGELITEEIINYIGTPTYPFQEETYMGYMGDIVTYNAEGEELSRTRPTEPKPITMFAGFSNPIFNL